MEPMEAEVLQAIHDILARELQISRPVHLTDDLLGDLELDSIGLVTLLAMLENRFRVRISKEESERVKTVADLAQAVLKLAGGS